MACHELAALRLGLMNVLGIDDEAEKEHELAELGDAGTTAGPVQSLSQSQNLGQLITFYEASLTDLEKRVAETSDDDKKLPYFRSLLILTKKVELELSEIRTRMNSFYEGLDEIHHFVHEIYPAD